MSTDEPRQETLKPCPFCGGAPIIQEIPFGSFRSPVLGCKHNITCKRGECFGYDQHMWPTRERAIEA